MKDNNLSELLSKKNEIYSKLIEDQNKGNFADVCNSCDYYQSIHVPHEGNFRHYKDSYINKLGDFFKIIN